jgi:fibronectin type 3 domain-containing protein
VPASGYKLDYWKTNDGVSIAGDPIVTVTGDGTLKAVYTIRPTKFDFGTGSSPVEPGYTQVTESTVYSAALGYGWDTKTGLVSRDRGAPDNLLRDLVQSTSNHTFKVDLDNGQYSVKLAIGDKSYRHDLIDVYAEDVLKVNHLTVNTGIFSPQVFTVIVSDGQLNIRFHDAGGTDLNWVINAIRIETGATGGQFDFGTASSPVESGYVQVTESTVYSFVAWYGWDSKVGLVSRDRGAPDDLRRDLVQSTGDHVFMVDLANGDYKVTLIIGDNNYRHDLIDVYAEDVLKVNHLTVDKGTFDPPQVFTVTVNDGQLNIKFHDAGGTDLNWVINAITIEPAA